MLKKILILSLSAIILSLSVVYAQTTPFRIAQNQANNAATFSNEQLSAQNANRYAALQNQVGSTVESHKRIVDESKSNTDSVVTKLDTAVTNYTSFNSRFLH